MAKQEETISSLKALKKDLSNSSVAALAEMKELLQEQKNHANDLEVKVLKMTEDTKKELRGEMAKVSDDCQYSSLKSQANSNRQNLVITGLQEDPALSPLAAAKDFIEQSLKIKDPGVDKAYRMGAVSPEDSSYIRPLVIKFNKESQ